MVMCIVMLLPALSHNNTAQQQGSLLHCIVDAVASTLPKRNWLFSCPLLGMQIAAAVAAKLQEKMGDAARFPGLQNLGRGIKQALPQLRESIRHCIEVRLPLQPTHSSQ